MADWLNTWVKFWLKELDLLNAEIMLWIQWTYMLFMFRLDGSKDPSASRVTLPVYLNATRGQLLFTVDFDSAEKTDGKDHRFYERGVALICSDLS